MNEEQYKELVERFGKEAAERMKTMKAELEAQLEAKYKTVTEGLMSRKEFDDWKEKELAELNKKLEAQEGINKTQGDKINELLGAQEAAKVSDMDDFLKSLMPKIKDLRKAGAGYIDITSEDLRKAGISTFARKVANTMSVGAAITDQAIAIGSPYLPGLGGSDLELFDIVRNPNYILNRVDVGRTNQSRLAWINETSYDGTVSTDIAEGTAKPQISHKFQVEFSTAKKAGAWIELTEEFEDDVPGLATAVRRMLQQDVIRAFDDKIQANLIAVARPYEITGLDAKVPYTNKFDAVGALLAQIGYYNYVPNGIGLNTVTNWEMMMDKDAEGRYLNPPFLPKINGLLVEANKIAVGFGLAGDFSQYKVDIYKEFTIRIGWINEQFTNNKFSVLGELRYHSYISDNRKKALVYNNLLAVQQKITAGS